MSAAPDLEGTIVPLDTELGQLVPRHSVVLLSLRLNRLRQVRRYERDRSKRTAEDIEAAATLGPHVHYQKLSERDAEIAGYAPVEPEIEYEFRPGIAKAEEDEDAFFWYWTMRATDDVGTSYRKDNGGTRAPSEAGSATAATRDVGGFIPVTAKRLFLDFYPPRGHEPPVAWLQHVEIDVTDKVAEVTPFDWDSIEEA